MAKNNTNKVIWLVIIGFFLSQIVGGIMWGVTGSYAIGVTMAIVMFAGVFGKKATESIGGWVVPLAPGVMLFSGTWGDWWKWVVCWLIAMFISNALSNYRPDYEKEQDEYDEYLNN